MKVPIITFCLIGMVFSNPISYNVVSVSSEVESNSTESVSVSQSAENDTSELQSPEDNVSNQSSQSESSESTEDTSEDTSEDTTEDTTSEESDSQSDENDGIDAMAETKDDSMSSEENVRKSWVRVFPNTAKALSAEDSNELPNTNLLVNPTDSSDSAGDSTETTAATSDSNASSSSESNETKESSDSSDASMSTEDSNASDSTELQRVKARDCVNGTQSCESEENIFQSIGDDAHFSVDNLMVPDEDERELMLR
ncbi:secretory calcium-binding phosphoprotein 1 [Archocentrus centrarchus]|uniref:secretory calcium-binding phosphoprotein 1 n=1 Tax=Archocentrus centrarchus TaxID=63155 RepID=UPI0011E9DBAC|nr:dentin sialophosphoprotein-like [Archocentrus centrarchus]